MSRFVLMSGAVEHWSTPWAQAMCRATIEGAIVFGLLWLLLRWLRRMPPTVQCWLWRAAYAKLFVSLLWAGTITLRALPPAAAAGPYVRAFSASQAAGMNASNVHRVAGQTSSNAPAPWSTLSDAAVATPFLSRSHIASCMFVLWCIGVSVGLARLAMAYRRAVQRRAKTTPLLDRAMMETFERLCRTFAMRRQPDVLVCAHIDVPLLTGIRRPAILIPAAFMGRVGPAKLRAMFAHELAHMQRGDLLWGWLPAIANALFFFHPGVWLARRELSLACEMACDEAAVTGTSMPPADYLAMLLELASGRRPIARPGFATASIVESFQTLQRRFLAMSSPTRASVRRRMAWATAASVLAIVGVLPWRIAPRSVSAAAEPPQAAAPDQHARVAQPARPPAIKTLRDIEGAWSGSKSGVAVELNVDGQHPRRFAGHWTITFARSKAPERPGEATRIEVRKSADLRCVVDARQGTSSFYLPAYLGDDKAIQQSSWSGKTPVAVIHRLGPDTLQLRIIPTGYDDPAKLDFDFPAAENLVLHRAAQVSQ